MDPFEHEAISSRTDFHVPAFNLAAMRLDFQALILTD